MGLIPDEVFLGRISEVRTFAEGLAGDLKAELDITTDRIRSQIDGIGSSDTFNNFDASAIVGTIRRTQIEEGFASADELTLLESSLASAESRIDASILESSRVQSSESGAVARRVEVVRAQLGGFEASVASEASARATADGFLEGKYALTATAGNVVTGLNITSSTGAGTDISEISFQADKFQIFNGTSSIAVFSITGLKAGFTSEVEIDGSLLISGTVTADSLSAATGTLGALTIGSSGHIKLGQTAYNTGTGFWLGDAGGTTKFSLGDSAADRLTWDGSAFNLVATEIVVGDPTAFNGWGFQVDGDILLRNFGAGNQNVGYIGNVATGTIGSPGATAGGSFVGLGLRGYDGQSWIGGTNIRIKTTANWSSGNTPEEIEFITNSGSSNNYLYLSDAGKLEFGAGRATNLFEESSGVLKTDDQFKCYSLETTGGGINFNTDVNLFRESSDVLKTDDAFKCYSLETTGGGIRSDSSGGYGVMELAGPSGAFIDLSKDPEGDYDLRIMADGNPRIETDENNDLGLLPHGTGKLKFGTHAASADVAVSGYITIKDAGGTIRKLAVIS